MSLLKLILNYLDKCNRKMTFNMPVKIYKQNQIKSLLNNFFN